MALSYRMKIFQVSHFSMLFLQRMGSALDTVPRAVFECKMHSLELHHLVINLLTFVHLLSKSPVR